MARQVVAPDLPVQPLLMHGAVDVIVVAPVLIAGVVGRVDVDALHPTGEGGQQRLKRQQVVAVDDQVIVQAGSPRVRNLGVRHELAVGHGQVQRLNEGFAFELEGRHCGSGFL